MGSRLWRARMDRGHVLRSCPEGAARSAPSPPSALVRVPSHRLNSQQWPVPGLQLRRSTMLTTERAAAFRGVDENDARGLCKRQER